MSVFKAIIKHCTLSTVYFCFRFSFFFFFKEKDLIKREKSRRNNEEMSKVKGGELWETISIRIKIKKSGVQRIKIINKRQHACKMDRHDYQTTECSCG